MLAKEINNLSRSRVDVIKKNSKIIIILVLSLKLSRIIIKMFVFNNPKAVFMTFLIMKLVACDLFERYGKSLALLVLP